MTDFAGAIARQRHYLTLWRRRANRETIRQTWSISYADPGSTAPFGDPPAPAERHAPTSLTRAVSDTRWIYRGACLACPWEGENCLRRDEAIEDAHDHTHPGWRDLPIFDRSPTGRGGTVWARHVRAVYPNQWFEAGGPLRLYIAPPFDRHEPGRAPGGGFILYTARPKQSRPENEQLLLV
ncbi:DUF6349 family protein [Streptomyces sp. NPDC056463]|uniref:DUF6349 family protein n=1 Tax=Streptomyces sp. NPDC056463 TaxID=3345827 RepID=UPI00367FB2DB